MFPSIRFTWILSMGTVKVFAFIIYTFRENREYAFIIIVQFMMSANRYVLSCRSYSFVCTLHHLIIIIVQNCLKTFNLQNACQIYFVECVSKIKHILSGIHYTIHYTIRGAVCFQFTPPPPCDYWENICTLSYYHHQMGSMNYYPLFRVRSWNNGVRCMSFYILMMTSSNGNIFRVTGHLCWEFTGPRWILRTKASDAEVWCSLWSTSESTVEQTIVRLVILDAIAPIVTSL